MKKSPIFFWFMRTDSGPQDRVGKYRLILVSTENGAKYGKTLSQALGGMQVLCTGLGVVSSIHQAAERHTLFVCTKYLAGTLLCPDWCEFDFLMDRAS